MKNEAVFTIIWDPERTSQTDYDALVTALDNLVKACGGDGVKLIKSTVTTTNATDLDRHTSER